MQNTISKPCFKIGELEINGDLVLAPMDGFSDSPFRGICREMGSAFSYTEFINAIDVIQHHPRLEERISFEDNERPIFFQIFDSDPERIVKAALLLSRRSPDGIDINLGCSVRRVSGRGAGAGLLKEPAKVAQIFRRLTSELDIPITGKIRLGWDAATKNYLEIAKVIQDNGGKMVAVHARTKQDGFHGQVNFDAVAEIKQNLSIPVIGNGDVRTVLDIERMKELTQCDAVMIGRGAIGNPWIFQKRERFVVDNMEKMSTITVHLKNMQRYYGKQRGLLLFRKHLKQYLAGMGLQGREQQEILRCDDQADLVQKMQQLIET